MIFIYVETSQCGVSVFIDVCFTLRSHWEMSQCGVSTLDVSLINFDSVCGLRKYA